MRMPIILQYADIVEATFSFEPSNVMEFGTSKIYVFDNVVDPVTVTLSVADDKKSEYGIGSVNISPLVDLDAENHTEVISYVEFISATEFILSPTAVTDNVNIVPLLTTINFHFSGNALFSSIDIQGKYGDYRYLRICDNIAVSCPSPYSLLVGDGVKTVQAFSSAFGIGAIAQGSASHAEGLNSMATGAYSHAEGDRTIAEGRSSHADGKGTIALGDASHACGKFNKCVTSEDIFVIGNGNDKNGVETRSNAFRVTLSGATYTTGAVNTSGADYAEFFEWKDGNPDAEDRVGHFVTMDGEFIRYASQGDYILGIVSGNPAVVGNSDEDYKHRWLKDDFGRLIREYLEPSEELIDTTDMSEDEIAKLRSRHNIEERDGAFYRKTEVPTDHVTASWRFKQSPDYNPYQSYTERKDRPEWDYVGMLGVLAVYDDGTCEVNSYCQCGENGIATKSSMAIAGQSFRVIKRISPNIVKVVFR